MRLRRSVGRVVAWSKPLIPDRAWPALLTARSLIADGPIVGQPTFRRPVVLAAHPDDETIGCGGLLALLARDRVHTTVVFATDGEATRGSAAKSSEIGLLRRQEAQSACAILGVADHRFLGFADGDLPAAASGRNGGPLGAAIAQVLSESNADAVVAPWFGDGHPDHRALTSALLGAGVDPDLEVWTYETWTPLPCNRVVDISDVFDLKCQALRAHKTAGLAFDLEAVAGLNRYRSVYGLMGRGHAEAFLASTVEAYARFAKRVEEGLAELRRSTNG